MRTAVRIVQIFVGLLFIVSGLAKANDPLGLSYKMQEFFELWSASLTPGSALRNLFLFFHSSSLALSVSMITLEILTGVALLLGMRKRLVLWLLLLLMIFFTFLTGYAYLSGRFTNCGCFGDCLPITPLTSFLKDIGLLVLVLFLLTAQRFIATILSRRLRTSIFALSLLLSLGLQWYALNYLPLADCLPFKKGNNISEQMKPPPGSRPDSVVINYVYEKAGKRYEWAANELPADFNTYKYVDRIDKVVRKGNADPPIKGLSLVGLSGGDSTQVVLQTPKAVLVFALDFADPDWLSGLKALAQEAQVRAIPVFLASTNAGEGARMLAANGFSGVQLFNTDFTVVRTVARTTPTVLYLKAGTVTEKFSRHHLAAATQKLSTL